MRSRESWRQLLTPSNSAYLCRKKAMCSWDRWKFKTRETSTSSKVENSGFSPKKINHLSKFLNLSWLQFTQKVKELDIESSMRLPNCKILCIKGALVIKKKKKNPFNQYQAILLPLLKYSRTTHQPFDIPLKTQGNQIIFFYCGTLSTDGKPASRCLDIKGKAKSL